MQVAARWLGLGSHVVGALAGAVLAAALMPAPLERLTQADAKACEADHIYSVQVEGFPAADVDECLDRHAGWLFVDRNDNGRATRVAMSGTFAPLLVCFAQAEQRSHLTHASQPIAAELLFRQ
jgi:hypothetical protein